MAPRRMGKAGAQQELLFGCCEGFFYPKCLKLLLCALPRLGGAAEELSSHPGGGSGGYLEHIFRHAALELFGIHVGSIHYKPLK